MSAVISGSGLGLFQSNLTSGIGAFGNAALGQAKEQVYVNAATGSLVVQNSDEALTGLGLGFSMLRTYNSAAGFDGDNDDQWRLGYLSTISLVGEEYKRVTADGFVQTFRKDALGNYVSFEGAASADRLTIVAANEVYVTSEGGIRETYRDGKLTDRTTPVGGYSVVYNSGKPERIIQRLTNGLTDETLIQYYGSTDAAAGLIKSIKTSSATGLQNRVEYRYDTAKRLQYVLIDKTPQLASDNNATFTSDSNRFVIQYGYADATSKRLTSIKQFQGNNTNSTADNKVELAVTYYADTEAEHIRGRVQTLTQGLYSTTFTYIDANKTRVTQGSQTVDYEFDANERLVNVSYDLKGGASASAYTYNGNGQLETITDSLGQVTRYTYDISGNLVSITAPGLAANNRTYNSQNQLQTEQIGSAIKRYVYDSTGQFLRFALGADGSVSEFRYNALNQQIQQRVYHGKTVSLAGLSATQVPTLATMESWVSTLTDKTAQQLTEFEYDIRGNLSKRRQFSAIDSTGNGSGDVSTWLYLYDFRGQLLQETKPLGSGTAAAFDETVTYSYDGLGRVLTRVDAQNNSTNFVFNDGNRTMEVRYDNGKVERSTYDKSGQITTVRTEDAFNGAASLGDVTYLYDDAGRQVAERDQHGQWVYRFFEENGALAADVGKGGEVRRYYYDKAGRLIKTVEFSGWGMSRSGWIVSNKLNYTLAALDVVLDGRLTSDPARRESMVIYKDNRKQFDIDAAGYVTEYRYTVDGQLQNMRRYATAATAAEIGAQLVGFNTNGALASQITYTYDISGRLKTETNGEGYRTEYHYDVAGRKIATTQYVKKVVNDAVTATPGEDRVEHWRYDAQGRVVASVTADGVVRRFQYDINGQLLQQDQYATTVRNLAIGAQLTLPSGTVRSTTYTYDGNGRVLTETAPDGITLAYRYDAVGNVIEKWQGQAGANRAAAQSRAVLSETFVNGESNKLIKSVSAGSTDQVFAESGRMVLSRQTAAAGVTASGYYSNMRLSTDLAASLAEPREYEFDLSFSQATGNYLPVYLSAGTWGQADATRFGVYANGSTLQFYKHFAGASSTTNVLSIAANATYRVKFITSREGVEVVVSELVNSQYIERGRTVHTVPALVRDKDYTLTFESNAQTTGYTQKAYVDNLAIRTFDAANPVDTTKAYTQERYQYDVNSRQIAALDANSNKALGLSASAAAVKAAFATTATTRNFYDLAGNLIESRDAEGNRSLFYYDSANRMTVSIDADRNLTRYVYNAFDELTQQLNAVKPVPEDQYARLLTDRASFADAGYEWSTREISKVLITYLSNDNTLATNKDPADVWQVITRNKIGQGVDLYRDLNLYGVNAAAGKVFQTYSALGANASQTMQQAYTVYDATSKTYKAQTGNLVLKQTQDLRGLTDTTLRNAVVQTDNDYDAFGRLIKTTATEGRINEVGYLLDVANDKVGRVVTSWQTVAGAQRKTISRYDAFDRLLETLDANGVVTTYSYDDQKRQYSVTVDGITTRTSRNEIGRVVLIEVLSGVSVLQSTQFDYDANGNQTDVWLNNVRQEGRSYTKNNQLEFLTNANGQKIQTRYSKTGKKVATIVDAEGLKLETSWKFGANTTVVQQTNGDRLSWVTYDKNGRVRYQDELEVLADGSRFKNRTSYKYDQAGNQLEVVTGVRIKIDAANNEVKDAQGQVIVDTTAQLVSRFEYDVLNRLIRQYQLAGSNVVSEVQFGYDQADRLIERVEVLSASQKIRTFYGYNEASELVYEAKSHSVNAASLQLSVQSYEYDKRGLKIAIHQYSQLLNTGVAETAALTPAVLAPKVLALTGKISSYIAYDVQGRQIATVNAVGQRNFTRYDGLGRVVETFTLATNSLLSAAELTALKLGTFTIPTAGAADSRIAYLYNELNQQVLKLVSTGTQALISAMTYDSQGQLIQARQYATTLAYRNNYSLK